MTKTLQERIEEAGQCAWEMAQRHIDADGLDLRRDLRALAAEVGELERQYGAAVTIVCNSVSDDCVEKIEQAYDARIEALEAALEQIEKMAFGFSPGTIAEIAHEALNPGGNDE